MMSFENYFTLTGSVFLENDGNGRGGLWRNKRRGPSLVASIFISVARCWIFCLMNSFGMSLDLTNLVNGRFR